MILLLHYQNNKSLFLNCEFPERFKAKRGNASMQEERSTYGYNKPQKPIFMKNTKYI